MAESLIVVGAKNAHTWNRTIGANSIEDEFTLPGEYPYASYIVDSGAVSLATGTSHPLQIMAGASLPVRIRKIMVEQAASATTAVIGTFAIYRLTTAGTGGTAITPRPFDTADAASGATAMTLPTVKGTEGVVLMEPIIVLRQGILTTATQFTPPWVWQQQPNTKPLIIPAGTANGLAIFRNGAAYAAASIVITVELVETNYV